MKPRVLLSEASVEMIAVRDMLLNWIFCRYTREISIAVKISTSSFDLILFWDCCGYYAARYSLVSGSETDEPFLAKKRRPGDRASC